jgi:hypothetical protein
MPRPDGMKRIPLFGEGIAIGLLEHRKTERFFRASYKLRSSPFSKQVDVFEI